MKNLRPFVILLLPCQLRCNYFSLLINFASHPRSLKWYRGGMGTGPARAFRLFFLQFSITVIFQRNSVCNLINHSQTIYNLFHSFYEILHFIHFQKKFGYFVAFFFKRLHQIYWNTKRKILNATLLISPLLSDITEYQNFSFPFSYLVSCKMSKTVFSLSYK